MSKRKYGWILLTLVASLAVIAASFTAGYFVRSPNEAAIANSQTPVVVTVPLEMRTPQGSTTEISGVVHVGTVIPVEIGEKVDGVVTAHYLEAGARVESGMPVIEISGRPLIALHLPFDLYRDLTVGDSGRDVRVVQEALRALGLYHRAVDGYYGPSTAAAVKALYQRSHMTPPEPVESRSPESAAPAGSGSSTGSGSPASPAAPEGSAAPAGATEPAGPAAPPVPAPAPRYTPLLHKEILSLVQPSAEVWQSHR